MVCTQSVYLALTTDHAGIGTREKLCLSGLQPASAVRVLEKTTSPPALPHIIADYMGDGAQTFVCWVLVCIVLKLTGTTNCGAQIGV